MLGLVRGAVTTFVRLNAPEATARTVSIPLKAATEVRRRGGLSQFLPMCPITQ